MKKIHTLKVYLYRVLERDKRGKQKYHLAEVRADCNENARRKIIHTALSEGGSVQVIEPTEDRSRRPGETAKRVYSD